MEEFLVNFFAGIVGGVISTFVFLFLMDRLGRPRIEISGSVAERDGVLRVKVINKSRSDLFDVRAELKLVAAPTPVTGRTTTRRINLRSDEYMGFRGYDRDDADFEYALVFLTDHFKGEGIDPREALADKNLRFRLHTSHGLTGFRKLFERIYSAEDIREGNFEKGNSFEVRP